MLYSKCNKLKINDWIPPLKISKQKTIQRNIKNNIKKNNSWNNKKNLTATDNNSISKEPDKRLIDKRFDNVKDWKKLENNSSKEIIHKNISNRCKKRYERKGNKGKSKEKYIKNQFINTAINPKGYTLIKLPIIIEREK